MVRLLTLQAWHALLELFSHHRMSSAPRARPQHRLVLASHHRPYSLHSPLEENVCRVEVSIKVLTKILVYDTILNSFRYSCRALQLRFGNDSDYYLHRPTVACYCVGHSPEIHSISPNQRMLLIHSDRLYILICKQRLDSVDLDARHQMLRQVAADLIVAGLAGQVVTVDLIAEDRVGHVDLVAVIAEVNARCHPLTPHSSSTRILSI